MNSYWVVPESAEDIVHYGVKGMKWGVRKAEYKSMGRAERRAQRKKYDRAMRKTNKSYTTSQRVRDMMLYGNGGVERINYGMNQGFTRKQAQRKELKRNVAVGLGTAAVYAGMALAPKYITKMQALGPVMKMKSHSMKVRQSNGAAFAQTHGLTSKKVVDVVGAMSSEKRKRF